MASLVELGSLPVLALAAFSIPLCSLAGALYILIRRKRIDLPFVGPRWAPLFGDPEAEVAYLKEGYEKYPDRPFQLYSQDGHYVVVPPKMVEELRNLPDDQMTALEATTNILQIGLLGADIGDPASITTIRNQLAHNLGMLQRKAALLAHLIKAGNIMPDVIAEVEKVLLNDLPQSSEWSSITVCPTLLHILAIIMGLIFVGPTLNHDPTYIKNSESFGCEVLENACAIKKYHPLFRPLMGLLIPELRVLFWRWRSSKALVGEFVKSANANPNLHHGLTVFNWFRDNIGKDQWSDVNRQTHMQLLSSMGAVHTSAVALTHAIFELAEHGEYQEPLREEFTNVVNENGGILNKNCMPSLMKLDSFLKETQRHSPPGYASFFRYLYKDLTLSDGTRLPGGTQILAPSYDHSMDPKVFNNPEKFDGFRFYDLRQQPGEKNKHQFATTALSALAFGHGRHSCPGRHLASYLGKTILGIIVRDYDIRLADGETRKPKNTVTGINNLLPDLEGKVLIRRRVKAN